MAHNNIIGNLATNLRKCNRLEDLLRKFADNCKLYPCVGVEIEFYLDPNINPNDFENELNLKLVQEKGKNQFEVDLPPSEDIISYVHFIENTRSKMNIVAKKLGGNLNLSAKPFKDDYGSSIHFHLSFGCCSDELLHDAARSLCHYMTETFLVFAPNYADYFRFDKNFMSPTNISFGGNNRSVAVRIPDSYPKRLEHRVSSPGVDPYLAIFTLLNSILLGIKFPDNRKKIDKIFGNAFDPQYILEPFPKSKDEALFFFNHKFFN